MSLLRSRVTQSLLAVLMALVGVFTVSVPANAYVTNTARIVQDVNTGSPLYVDAAVVFAKQADGTGVKVNWTGYSVNNCSLISGGGSPAWFDIHIRIYDGNTLAFVDGTDFPNTNVCSPTWTMNKSGFDEGFVRVVIMAAARRSNNLGRYWFEYKFDLYPSGNSVAYDAGWVNY